MYAYLYERTPDADVCCRELRTAVRSGKSSYENT